MSFQIIIISRNQSASLIEMVSCLKEQFPISDRLFVLDRCVDNSASILSNLNEKYIENKEGEGFLAGRMRDLGLSYLGIENTLFLDGDRFPVNFSTEVIERALSLYDICMARVLFDFRCFKNYFMSSYKLGQMDNDVFSCGFCIRKEMIEKVIAFQGRLFHPVFDGEFGEEDRYLGDVVYHLGGRCGLFPRRSYVKGSFSGPQDHFAFERQKQKRAELRTHLNVKSGYIPDYVNYLDMCVVGSSNTGIFIPTKGIFTIKEIWEDQCYTKYHIIKKDDIVVDIGANVGVFTLYALSLGAMVYAFEPYPESFLILKRNLFENKFPEERIYNVAIDGVDGHIELGVPDSEELYTLGSVSSKINYVSPWKLDSPFKKYNVKVGIDAISFNTLAEKYVGQKIDFLKIDCEGAEYDILETADLENVKYIAVETHDCYPEENLISLLEKKKFVIQEWVKRSGKYKTGYCYAFKIS
jgi:FkbM family methyltransferase